MRIKAVHLEQFKRFTDLSIQNIPQTAKLVVLLGPNGCGKSSVFDAFKTWHLFNGYRNGANNDYCRKDSDSAKNSFELVNIDFHTDISSFSQEQYHQFFYFVAFFTEETMIFSRIKRRDIFFESFMKCVAQRQIAACHFCSRTMH